MASYYLSLVRLQHIASLKPLFIIQKGKKYIKPGQTPPKGAVTHRGPHGGIFYFVEDKHLKNQGKEHELIRSRGVTRHEFSATEAKYKAQGAETVHFVHKPNLEKNQKGENLYNIYVNWGEATQKKIADKKAADKARYGHPRKKTPSTPPETKEVKPKPTGKPFRKISDQETAEKAEKIKQKLESLGKEAEVRERKYKSGYSVFGVYARNKEKEPTSKTPEPEKPWDTWKYKDENTAKVAARGLIARGKEVKLSGEWENKKGTTYILMHRDKPVVHVSTPKNATLTLNHSPKIRQAWVAKVEGHAPKWNAFIMKFFPHTKEEKGTRTFTLSDGLYQAGTGLEHDRHFEVKNGQIINHDMKAFIKKVHEAYPDLNANNAQFEREVREHNQKINQKPPAKEESEKYYEITGDTYNNRYDLASQHGISYDKALQKWILEAEPFGEHYSNETIKYHLDRLKYFGLGVSYIKTRKKQFHNHVNKLSNTAGILAPA